MIVILKMRREVYQHTINNDDYEMGWIFEDECFELLNGQDEVLLKFLCSVFHPVVRRETSCWKEFLEYINELLRNDGYELYLESKISGHDVYGWRVINSEDSTIFVPYSQRNEKAIKSKRIRLKLNMKTRNQVYQLLKRYSFVFRESTEIGWQYDITTDESVFRDISQFYKPKCYDFKGNYVETNDMEQFIMKSSPFCVLDAIELYEKYNVDNDFTVQVNGIFKLNSIAYKMDRGRIERIIDVSISKSDI